MKSLRARLLVGMIGSFALLLVVFGVVLDALIEYTLVREFDFYLETVAQTLAAAAESGGDRLELKLVPESLPDIQQVEGELFSQYWKDDGTVLAKSQNLAAQSLPRFSGAGGHPQVEPFVLPDGRPARAAGLRFPVPLHPRISGGSPAAPGADAEYLTLVVARDTTDLASHVRQLRWLLLAAGAATMTVGAVISIVVIRRSLRPLHRVAAAIATIKEDDLSTRIPATTMPEEIVPLVERLNELLHRLDEAFARERSLTADVAHELRTPVAGILATAGVALSADRTPADYREALGDVLGIARGMRSMTENLLTLARLDSQPAQFDLEPMQLRHLIDTCWRGCQDRAAARALAFENTVPEDLACASDRHALSIVFANLLENAADYTGHNGHIRVAARQSHGTIEIEVANTGCTLTQPQVARVFDRFWRADPSRKEARLHVGLGLALVRRIVTSLGGTVRADAAHGEFTVSIGLRATTLGDSVE
jgi:two-component system heavy metal sensor histidine kinase CusS